MVLQAADMSRFRPLIEHLRKQEVETMAREQYKVTTMWWNGEDLHVRTIDGKYLVLKGAYSFSYKQEAGVLAEIEADCGSTEHATTSEVSAI